jgi:hypothetical protein
VLDSAARNQTALVPRAVVHLDQERTRFDADGSLVAEVYAAGPPPVRTRTWRTHRAVCVVALEISDETIEASAQRATAVVAALGVGHFGIQGFWHRLVRAQIQHQQTRAQTPQGRAGAHVVLEFHGGLYRSVAYPVAEGINVSEQESP